MNLNFLFWLICATFKEMIQQIVGTFPKKYEQADYLVDQIKRSLQKYKRNAYIPVVEDDDGSLLDSKFGGTPYMRKEDKWPICGCGYPTEFGVQINLDTLPFNNGEFGTGILQFWKCPLDCDSNDSEMVRVIVPNDVGNKVPISDINQWQYEIGIKKLLEPRSLHCLHGDGFMSSDINELVGFYRNRHTEPHFLPKRIISWVREDDYPDLEEIEEEDLEEEIWEKHEKYNCWNYGLEGEKMGGWSHWYDRFGDEYKYPKCPICEEEMTTLLLKMGENSKIHKWELTDSTANIYQCPRHKEQVKYMLFGC